MSELLLMGLPASMSASLEQVAEIRQPLILLTRHSIREQALGDGFAGYALPLTEQGRQLAQAWGAALLRQTGRRLHSCISSPIQRCLDTASLMRAGQAQLLGIATEKLPPIEQQLLLVEPGGFVYDVAQAGPLFFKHGSLAFINAFLRQEVPGMKVPQHGVCDLLQLLHQQSVATTLESAADTLHLAVSHDTILAALLAVMAQQREITWADWPEMMEGVWLWFEGETFLVATVHWLWRGVHYCQSVQSLTEMKA